MIFYYGFGVKRKKTTPNISYLFDRRSDTAIGIYIYGLGRTRKSKYKPKKKKSKRLKITRREHFVLTRKT